MLLLRELVTTLEQPSMHTSTSTLVRSPSANKPLICLRYIWSETATSVSPVTTSSSRSPDACLCERFTAREFKVVGVVVRHYFGQSCPSLGGGTEDSRHSLVCCAMPRNSDVLSSFLNTIPSLCLMKPLHEPRPLFLSSTHANTQNTKSLVGPFVHLKRTPPPTHPARFETSRLVSIQRQSCRSS